MGRVQAPFRSDGEARYRYERKGPNGAWPEILNDARARLTFFSQQLDYQADSDSELEYLKRAHSKYIPDDLAEVATGASAGPDEGEVP